MRSQETEHKIILGIHFVIQYNSYSFLTQQRNTTTLLTRV